MEATNQYNEATKCANISWPLATTPPNMEVGIMVASNITAIDLKCKICGKIILRRPRGRTIKFCDSCRKTKEYYRLYRKNFQYKCECCSKIFKRTRKSPSRFCASCSHKKIKRIAPQGFSYCSKCLKLFPVNQFRFDKRWDRPSSLCKSCEKVRKTIWESNRRKTDPKFRIDYAMKAGIHKSLTIGDGKNGRSWESLVGYKSEDLIKHLTKRFSSGMTLENYGHGEGRWTIDHIIPRSLFNYKNAEDKDFERCWSLKNLQPMWYSDNVRKSNHIDKPFQPSLSI